MDFRPNVMYAGRTSGLTSAHLYHASLFINDSLELSSHHSRFPDVAGFIVSPQLALAITNRSFMSGPSFLDH